MSTCPICIEEIRRGCVTLDCRHEYCVRCFIKMSKRDNRCSLCRRGYYDKNSEERNINDKTYCDNLSDDTLQEALWQELIENSYERYYLNKFIKSVIKNENKTRREVHSQILLLYKVMEESVKAGLHIASNL